jgi:release factor glutamine methyltransferase
MTEVWTIGRVVRWAADDFRTRGIENPRLEAELLLASALGLERMRVIIEPERPLVGNELARYRDMIQRRRKGEPVAYILGQREFYGRVFKVDRRVLVPRPDTEILVEVALARTARCSMSARVLDLCTGSGCVAITLAAERPTLRIDAVDLSADAIAVARENAIRLGAVFPIRWLLGDLFAPIRGSAAASADAEGYDLMTANPPYIPESEIATLPADIRAFEPHAALSGGADGLEVTRRIVREAPRFLGASGVLAVEIGSGQGDQVAGLFVEAGFVDVQRKRDYGGHERVVSGVRG